MIPGVALDCALSQIFDVVFVGNESGMKAPGSTYQRMIKQFRRGFRSRTMFVNLVLLFHIEQALGGGDSFARRRGRVDGNCGLTAHYGLADAVWQMPPR